MDTTIDIIVFRNREQWNDWLQQNHDKKKEQWLAIFKKKYEDKGITYEEALEEAICFGWIDSLMRGYDNEKFILRFSPRRNDSPWSLKNKKRAEEMIAQGKMTTSGLKVIEQAKTNGWWDKAYSMKDTPEIPDDLAKELKQHKNAWEKFSALSNSDKARYIFWIDTAKRKETREKRIQSVIDKIL